MTVRDPTTTMCGAHNAPGEQIGDCVTTIFTVPSEPAVKKPGAPRTGVSDVLAAGSSPYFVCCPSLWNGDGSSALTVSPLCSRTTDPVLETVASTSARGSVAVGDGEERGLFAGEGNARAPLVVDEALLEAAELSAELLARA